MHAASALTSCTAMFQAHRRSQAELSDWVVHGLPGMMLLISLCRWLTAKLMEHTVPFRAIATVFCKVCLIAQ